MEEINKNQSQIDNTSNKVDLSVFVPHETTEEQAGEIFDKVNLALEIDTPPAKDVFAVMFDYFKEKKFAVEEVKKYHDTFWKMLVKVAWHILPSLNDETFEDVVAYTLPYAVSQNVEVKDVVFNEFYDRAYEKSQDIHNKIKDKILAVNYPIAFNELGKNITITDLAKRLNKREDGQDLSRFEMLSNVQKALFPDSELLPNVLKQHNTKLTTEFIDLLKFLTSDVKVDDIVVKYIVDKPEYDEPKYSEEVKGMVAANLLEKYVLEQENNTPEKPKTDTSAPESKPNNVPKTFAEDLKENKVNFAGWITEPATLRSMLNWLASFGDKVTARNELGKLLQTELGADSLSDMDLALAIVSLDEFLNKNSYPGDDFVHYDESTGVFKWGSGKV